jgi:hypothetical protein
MDEGDALMRRVVGRWICTTILGPLVLGLGACAMQQTNRVSSFEEDTDAETKEPKSRSASSDGGADAESSPVETPAKDSGPSAPTGPAVTGFTLINADNDQGITGFDPIAEGATITLADLPSQNINVRANTQATIGSVRFDLDGTTGFHVEGAAPYSLGGDNAGDFPPLTPALTAGKHTLVGTPFSEAAAAGTAGTSKTLTFTIK